MTEEVEFKALVGRHILSGVDFSTESVKRWNRFEDSSVVNFVLDGITYTAVEDPDDGYRSSLESLYISDITVTNQFEPCPVLIRIRERTSYGKADVLQMIDEVTGKVVFEVGTDDIDDYYPSFVSNFMPENMAINQVTHND